MINRGRARARKGGREEREVCGERRAGGGGGGGGIIQRPTLRGRTSTRKKDAAESGKSRARATEGRGE